MNKKKLNKADYIFKNISNQTLVKLPGQINGIDFYIADLEGCEVYLFDYMAQILIDDCKNCKIHLGPVESSVFLRGSSNIILSSASKQLRISDSENIDAFVYCTSDPSLENCLNIRIAPFNFQYPKIREHFGQAQLDVENPEKNKWSQVFDFTPNKEKKNWSILPPEEFCQVIKNIESFENDVVENPVALPQVYGGSIEGPIIVGSQESKEQETGMMTFNITTTSNEAEKIIMNKENLEEIKESSPFYEEIEEPQQYRPQEEFKFESQETILKKQAQSNLILEQIRQKQIEETRMKQNNFNEAQNFLSNWKKNYLEQIKTNKINNRENQKLSQEKTTEEYKNPWTKIVENINIKIGDNLGQRDITEMRQAILNKQKDMSLLK